MALDTEHILHAECRKYTLLAEETFVLSASKLNVFMLSVAVHTINSGINL
jgi:hypothetical protein